MNHTSDTIIFVIGLLIVLCLWGIPKALYKIEARLSEIEKLLRSNKDISRIFENKE